MAKQIAAAILGSLLVHVAQLAEAQDLTELDLDALVNMDVTITSAAKRAQAGADAAAAVFVITREDIRRSGATSVAELLRVAPGLQVARISNQRWAVASRGFNSRFSTKLLGLVDGRSIYSPSAAGIYWEEQPVLLENIERIEIIRGPGGALWGANAVNGIVNIITRSAAADRGLHLDAAAGDEERGAASLRYGGTSALGDYRLHAHHFERDSLESADNPWKESQAGWRLDRALYDGDLSFAGDVHRGDLGVIGQGPRAFTLDAEGGNAHLRWQGPAFAAGHLDLSVHSNWRELDRSGRLAQQQSATGIDAQYDVRTLGRHEITLGVGLVHLDDHLARTDTVFDPARTSHNVWSIYAQNQMHFLGDAAYVILGAKFEDYELAGSAFQPTLRGLWRVGRQHTVWAAASRAVRTPSRFEMHGLVNTFTVPGNPPLQFRISGNPNLDFEALEAYELGWRYRPAERLSFDLALFENRYDELSQTQRLAPVFDAGPPPALIVTNRFANSANAKTHGAELAIDWIANEHVQLQAAASWLDLVGSDSASATSVNFGGVDAEHSYWARARVDLLPQLDLDFVWRYVDELSAFGIPSYTSLDARLGWHVTQNMELSIAMENLLNDRHVEFFNEETFVSGSVIGRSFLARISWRGFGPVGQ
jgi:iron complex outermembrane receptor protein